MAQDLRRCESGTLSERPSSHSLKVQVLRDGVRQEPNRALVYSLIGRSMGLPHLDACESLRS